MDEFTREWSKSFWESNEEMQKALGKVQSDKSQKQEVLFSTAVMDNAEAVEQMKTERNREEWMCQRTALWQKHCIESASSTASNS